MIRPMTLEDIETVQMIANISWQHTYDGIIPVEVQQNFLAIAYSKAMLAKRIEKTNVFIAEYEGINVGYASFTNTDEDGDAELTSIYILPEYQKMGLGTKLLQAGLEKVKSAQQLLVYVESQNWNGRNFYESKNFELIEEFDDFFQNYPLQTAKYVYYLKAPVTST